jgi:XTP/dITP diphosphohydrolase
MDELREGCPWDKKQTIQTLRELTIEETYELSEAIVDNDLEEIKKELGDLMLHLVFYTKIASETNAFTITDVLNSICEKLIHRHPHIYGDVKVENEEDVKRNWEKLKLQEKGRKSVLDGVPKALPPLNKAYRIQQKAGAVGFEWNKKEDVWDKVKEELAELLHEVETNASKDRLEDEFGDVLFSLVNYARYIGVRPADAIERTNQKFLKRFKYVEQKAEEQGSNVTQLSLEEMDAFWEEAKLVK